MIYDEKFEWNKSFRRDYEEIPVDFDIIIHLHEEYLFDIDQRMRQDET